MHYRLRGMNTAYGGVNYPIDYCKNNHCVHGDFYSMGFTVLIYFDKWRTTQCWSVRKCKVSKKSGLRLSTHPLIFRGRNWAGQGARCQNIDNIDNKEDELIFKTWRVGLSLIVTLIMYAIKQTLSAKCNCKPHYFRYPLNFVNSRFFVKLWK